MSRQHAGCRGPWGSLPLTLALSLPILVSAEAPGPARIVDTYGQVPLSFEANTGQTDAQVAFLARGAGYALFLTPTEAVLSLGGAEQAPPATVRLRLRGANAAPRVSGLDPQATRSHYFIGNDPARWRSDVPHFGKVRYEAVYPGIDLVYYGRQRQLEYDFVVQPGADPRQIRLDFAGADRLELDSGGDLLVHVGPDTLRQHKPVVYQERDGQRESVAGAYVLEGRRRAAFSLGGYDRSRAVVIDPVLAYSTYLGGGDVDLGSAIAVDRSGSAYVTGTTLSADFPTANPLEGTLTAGAYDAFVTKLSAGGSALVYSTYLEGSDYDEAHGIAVDGSGDAYVTGYSQSNDFPTANALQGTPAGFADAFVTKLSAAGSALVYSTYLGGSSNDGGQGITVDSYGNAYVTGGTRSADFPTANPLQTLALFSDVFVTKLSTTGAALVYSTYLGGGGDESGMGIAVDGSGSAYITGSTHSADFPTVNPIQGTMAGNAGNWEAFVAKLNAAGSALVYSTYLGGSDTELAYGIAVDGTGNAYVAGETRSTDFPTANPLQGTSGGGGTQAFVTKLDAVGSALVYSTYLGGSRVAVARAIAVDGAGGAYVTGETGPGFPVVNPIQGVGSIYGDAFVARLNPPGSALTFSTFLGGSSMNQGRGIAVDRARDIYITGRTYSPDFPTVNPFQASLASVIGDAFVARIATFTKGDLDGDGGAELVFRNNQTGVRNKVWVMNGVAGVAELTITPDAPSADWKVRGVDDFDGDQRNDLVFWNQATGQVEFWLMNGASRVGAPVPLAGGPVLSTNWDLAATADFDHDGRPDIVWRNFDSQKIVIWTMNGVALAGGIFPTPDQAVNSNWAVVAARDYNNDGLTDFLWYNSTTGKIVTWYMDASAARTTGQFTSPANAGDNNWKVLASADYSRAGLPGTPPLRSPDIVWRNETSGNQVVWHMDFAGNRVYGEFTSPAANTNPLKWTIVGPR